MIDQSQYTYAYLYSFFESYNKSFRPLPGIINHTSKDAFVFQLLDSIRRVIYFNKIGERSWESDYANPYSEYFHPLKGAVHYFKKGDIDEAFWLIFLMTHFGKQSKSGWKLIQTIYGNLGIEPKWSWVNISDKPKDFRTWLSNHEIKIKTTNSNIGFGNHRKFQSLNASSAYGTGSTIESYIGWIREATDHQSLFSNAFSRNHNNPKDTFDFLFNSMRSVIGFGRTARFDYLTYIGELSLFPIEPKYAYLQNSTGPIFGAKLLFGGDKYARIGFMQLEEWLREIDSKLNIGKRVLEDALCNWQKSPEKYIRFRE